MKQVRVSSPSANALTNTLESAVKLPVFHIQLPTGTPVSYSLPPKYLLTQLKDQPSGHQKTRIYSLDISGLDLRRRRKSISSQELASISTGINIRAGPWALPPIRETLHLEQTNRIQTTKEMSLVNLSNVCSHLQNASRGRLSLTSIPSTNLTLALSLALQNSGFISSVTRSGPHPPQILTATDLPHATHPDFLDPNHPDTAHVTKSNIASRRLWLGLKYWKEQPVLKECKMISKPKQRIWVGYRDLEQLVLGRDRVWVKGLSRVGECMFVTTDQGVMESRECVERRMGGMLLCRVSG